MNQSLEMLKTKMFALKAAVTLALVAKAIFIENGEFSDEIPVIRILWGI